MNIRDTFKRKKPRTVSEKMHEQVERAKKYHDSAIQAMVRIERLDMLYPKTINYTDIFISKYLTLYNGLEITKRVLVFMQTVRTAGRRSNERGFIQS